MFFCLLAEFFTISQLLLFYILCYLFISFFACLSNSSTNWTLPLSADLTETLGVAHCSRRWQLAPSRPTIKIRSGSSPRSGFSLHRCRPSPSFSPFSPHLPLTAVRDPEDSGLVSIHKALLIYSDPPLAKPFIAAISRMSPNGQRRKGLRRD